jgi:hypothetical protein
MEPNFAWGDSSLRMGKGNVARERIPPWPAVKASSRAVVVPQFLKRMTPVLPETAATQIPKSNFDAILSWRGVLAANPRHIPTASFFCQPVF